MRFPGFVGPSYMLDSTIGDLERCVNLFPEPVESGNGKSPVVLRSTPGLSLFTTLGNPGDYDRVCGMIVCFGVSSGSPRYFAVAGKSGGAAKLFELFYGGTSTDRGAVSAAFSLGPVFMAYNETQLCIAIGGSTLWIFTFATNVLTQVAAHAVTAAAVAAGGTGYLVNDILTVVGGLGLAATLRVATLGGGGAVATVTIETSGQYSANPTNPVATTGGSGNGAATFNLTLDTTALGISPNQVVYLDGYFITNQGLNTERQRFYISSLKNGFVWNALDFSEADFSPDIIVALLTNHDELWILGQDGVQPYYNSGNADFPFTPIQGAVMESGCGAQGSAIKVEDQIIWMSHLKEGRGVVWMAVGYNVKRISTYAVEQAIRSYANSPAGITDAVAWSYQDQGHTFYVLTFPAAGHTWVYDLTTTLWHERMYWSGTAEQVYKGYCHIFAFWESTPFKGRHLVGAVDSGKIYDLSTAYYDDAGDTIRRIRRCPHLASEAKRNFYNSIIVDLEPNLATNQRLNLRWSDNGGKTYCAYKQRNVGPSVNSAAVTGATIVGGGAGYTLNDVLTVVGGDGTAATLKATGVTAGVITAVTVFTGGAYTGNPINPVSVTGGTGSNATFTLVIPGIEVKRAKWDRLGSSRDKVFELMLEDPVKWTLTDAYLEMEPGYN